MVRPFSFFYGCGFRVFSFVLIDTRIVLLFPTFNMLSVLVDTTVPARPGDLYFRTPCFSPDGNLLATGAEDNRIRVS